MKKKFLPLVFIGISQSIYSVYGMENISKEDYGVTNGIVLSGFDLLKMGVNAGNPMSLYVLGNAYLKGFGIPKDFDKAVDCFLKSAQKGHVEAEFNLGDMYLNGWIKNDGRFVAPNFIEAFKWYEKAAQHGLVESQYNLGVMYYEGKWVEKDLDKALQWLLKAAKQGNIPSQVRVAGMYREGWIQKDGTLVPANPEKLFYWNKKTADTGDAHSLHDLGNLYYRGHGTQKDLDKAFECYLKAAHKGLDVSQKHVGFMLENGWQKANGTLVQSNIDEAIKWYEKSADQNGKEEIIQHIISFYNNRWTRQNGTSAQPNAERVFYWTKKLAIQGNETAQLDLNNFYSKGQGTPQNSDEALLWGLKAAQKGNAGAQHNVGLAFENGWTKQDGTIVPPNLKKALYWYEKAAKQGTPNSLLNLGVMYFSGKEVKPNKARGIQLIFESSVLGFEPAQNNFKKIFLLKDLNTFMDSISDIPFDKQQISEIFEKIELFISKHSNNTIGDNSDTPFKKQQISVILKNLETLSYSFGLYKGLTNSSSTLKDKAKHFINLNDSFHKLLTFVNLWIKTVEKLPTYPTELFISCLEGADKSVQSSLLNSLETNIVAHIYQDQFYLSLGEKSVCLARDIIQIIQSDGSLDQAFAILKNNEETLKKFLYEIKDDQKNTFDDITVFLDGFREFLDSFIVEEAAERNQLFMKQYPWIK